MTEDEWLTSTDPLRMLTLVQGHSTPRQLRLLLAACARCYWAELPPPFRAVVEAAERCADGRLTEDDLRHQTGHVYDWFVWRARAGTRREPLYPAGMAFALTARYSARRLAQLPGHACWSGPRPDGLGGVIRDLFGNPFRPAAFAPGWRTAAVRGLAEAVDTGPAFDLLPVLADALEEGGCDDPDLLAHCRAGGPHVRGCWAVDRCLGRA